MGRILSMINLQSRAWRSTIAAALLFIEGLVVLSLDIYLIVQNFIADNVDDRHALLGEIIYATAGAERGRMARQDPGFYGRARNSSA